MLLLSLRGRHRHFFAMAAASSQQQQQKKKSATAAGVATAAPQPKRRRATAPSTADADDSALPASSHGPSPLPPPLLAKAEKIRTQLAALYPPPVPIPLNHSSPFQLLVAVVLSAQSTDAKVNEATPALFAKAPDPQALAALGADGILPYIKSLGLAPTKSRNLAAMSSLLIERHGGAVPSTLTELVALPGVGRKTASVVLSQAFGGNSFPVDTHIHRLAQRWGLTVPGPSVEQTERDLRAVFVDPSHWRDLHLRIIYFGREHCAAKGHDPSRCPICSWAAVPPFDAVEGGGEGGGDGDGGANKKKRAASVSPVKAGGGGGAASALLAMQKKKAEGGGAGGGGEAEDDDASEEPPRRRRAARGIAS
jgi:endonuclease-3